MLWVSAWRACRTTGWPGIDFLFLETRLTFFAARRTFRFFCGYMSTDIQIRHRFPTLSTISYDVPAFESSYDSFSAPQSHFSAQRVKKSVVSRVGTAVRHIGRSVASAAPSVVTCPVSFIPEQSFSEPLRPAFSASWDSPVESAGPVVCASAGLDLSSCAAPRAAFGDDLAFRL